jgi:hypothetical protein
MDLELIIWITIFLGGYGAVLGYLLRIALRKAAPRDPDPSR